MSKFKVLIAGLGVVVLWASAFPAIRVAAPDLRVIGLSVVRLAVASLALLAPLAHARPARWWWTRRREQSVFLVANVLSGFGDTAGASCALLALRRRFIDPGRCGVDCGR